MTDVTVAMEGDFHARTTIARYAHAVDAKDLDALRDVFWGDATLFRPEPVEGREAILAFYGGFFASEVGHLRHFITTSLPTTERTESGLRVTIDSNFLYLHVLGQGVRLGWGDYRDVVEVRDGQARLASKRIATYARSVVDIADLDDALRKGGDLERRS